MNWMENLPEFWAEHMEGSMAKEIEGRFGL